MVEKFEKRIVFGKGKCSAHTFGFGAGIRSKGALHEKSLKYFERLRVWQDFFSKKFMESSSGSLSKHFGAEKPPLRSHCDCLFGILFILTGWAEYAWQDSCSGCQ